MSKEMFPTLDSVDNKSHVQYTAYEIHRIADALERISYLLEVGVKSNEAGNVHLDNGITSGAPPASANEAMTVSEAAKMLRISLPKMYEIVHDGKVHTLSIGRKILVSRSSLLKLIQEGD